MISAVIPVYNEEEVIDEFSNRLVKCLHDLNVEYEAIFIVEGNDHTRDKLFELSNQDHNVKVEYSEKKLGLGRALKKGLSQVSSSSDYVLTMDADLNHHPEELDRFLDASKKYDIVIGSRSRSEKGLVAELPFFKRMISGGTNWVLKKVFSVPTKDLTSGYRLYATKKIELIRDEIKGKNFEVQAEILIRAQKRGFSITEVPITFTPRPRGTSKLSFFRTGLGYAILILRLRF